MKERRAVGVDLKSVWKYRTRAQLYWTSGQIIGFFILILLDLKIWNNNIYLIQLPSLLLIVALRGIMDQYLPMGKQGQERHTQFKVQA